MKAASEVISTLRVRWHAILPAGAPFFAELIADYHTKNRHYHNLQHLVSLFEWSDAYAGHLQEQDVVELAIFYHDIIYNPLRQDNEARSAECAVRELQHLGVQEEKVNRVATFIRATAKHDLGDAAAASDLAYFLDFDLAILGSDWNVYQNYTRQIRKEYKVYPGFLYKQGRIKVLQAFLAKPHIFFTAAIREQLETKARSNMQRELEILSR